MKKKSAGMDLISAIFKYVIPLALLWVIFDTYETTTFLVLFLLSSVAFSFKNSIYRIIYITFIGFLPFIYVAAFPYLPEQLQFTGNDSSFDTEFDGNI